MRSKVVIVLITVNFIHLMLCDITIQDDKISEGKIDADSKIADVVDVDFILKTLNLTQMSTPLEETTQSYETTNLDSSETIIYTTEAADDITTIPSAESSSFFNTFIRITSPTTISSIVSSASPDTSTTKATTTKLSTSTGDHKLRTKIKLRNKLRRRKPCTKHRLAHLTGEPTTMAAEIDLNAPQFKPLDTDMINEQNYYMKDDSTWRGNVFKCWTYGVCVG